MRARAGLETAPHGDRIKDGLSGTSPPKYDADSDQPLMITNGGMGEECAGGVAANCLAGVDVIRHL